MALAPNLLAAVRTALMDADVHDAGDWPVYIVYGPDTQNKIMVITPTGGIEQDTLGGENVLPSFQIMVRGDRIGYQLVEEKAWEVYNTINDIDLSSAEIYLIQAFTTPTSFFDDNNRAVSVINFRAIHKKPVVS